MEVKLIGYIPDIEKIVAASALSTRSKTADKILTKISTEKSRKKIGEFLSYGHEGISEFAFFIFSVDGVSRVLTHQLVRHRIASYLQLSSRHIDLSNMGFVIPPKILSNKKANDLYVEFMNEAIKKYKELLKLGIGKEDARFIFPDSIMTHIVIGMNARSLNNFFGRRLCKKAQWEIRELVEKMRDIVFDISPSLFWSSYKPCVLRGLCPEKSGCGYDKTDDFIIERTRYIKGYPNE